MSDKLTIEDILNKRVAKKEQNEKFCDVILNSKKIVVSENMKISFPNCGTFLKFLADRNLENIKLAEANFCGNRFCPHCSWNKARKDAFELLILTEALKRQGYKFIFLTLTAPNVKGEKLNDELNDFTKSFKRLMELKEVKKIVKGYVRKLEVTYNEERDDYHPHYHVLIAVNKSYFSAKGNYISQKKWLEFWRKAKRDESITQVDVRKFDIDKNADAIFEMSKYIAKDSNYLISVEVFEKFYFALKGKREFSFNGIYKKVKQDYKLGKLDFLIEQENIDWFYKFYAKWDNGTYKKQKPIVLGKCERNFYNSQIKNEVELD